MFLFKFFFHINKVRECVIPEKIILIVLAPTLTLTLIFSTRGGNRTRTASTATGF